MLSGPGRTSRKATERAPRPSKPAEAELVVAQSKLDQEKSELGNLSHLPSDDPQRAQAYKDFAAAEQRYWSALSNVNWYTGHPTETQQNILDGEVALAEAQLAEAQSRLRPG